MAPGERQEFVKKVWTPLETIAKHLAVERSKYMEEEGGPDLAATRYQETLLDNKDEGVKYQQENDPLGSSFDDPEKAFTVPPNHKSTIEDDYASTEKYEFEAQKIVGTTTESECDDYTTVIPEEATTKATKSGDVSKDIDTDEGFKRFSDSVSRSN